VGIEFDIDIEIQGQRRMSMLAEQQHGLVTRAQLRELGLGPGAIDYRVGSGTLVVVRRGVYALGHSALRPQARALAAVLGSSADAALSHAAAAAHWEVRPSAAALIDVTVPRRIRGQRGIRHHFADLPADQITIHDSIPVTTVARTIVDLAGVVSEPALRRAMEAAEAARLVDWAQVEALAQDRRRGVRELRVILAEREVGARVTKRELEAAFLDLLRREGLPLPATNAFVGGFEVDCVWRDARLVVELDSRRFHGTDGAFERDRARDRRLAAAGWTVVRVTWRQIHDEPTVLLADLRGLILRARAG
jgi:very-short-patch-repair endonuclease